MNLSQLHPDLMLPVKVVPLTQGKFAIVDPEDYEAVMTMGSWFTHREKHNWYAWVNKKGTVTKMHKFLTGYELVDHANRNGLDNRRVNLRDSTPALNCRNTRLHVNNKSGYPGVSFNKAREKWYASITRKGRTIGLGYHLSPEEANAARVAYIERTNWYAEA